MVKKLLFTIVIILSYLLLAEGIARIFYRPAEYKKVIEKRYEPKDDDFYTRHKNSGWILKPGYNNQPGALKEIGRVEHYSINNQSLRNKEYPLDLKVLRDG